MIQAFYNRIPCFGEQKRHAASIHGAIIIMNRQDNNILSRLDREYVSFLYDNARRTTNQTVTIDQINEFIKTPEGQKGLTSFKAMKTERIVKEQSEPRQIGEFL